MLVTVRWPGVRMAPISSISAWRQLRWKNSGAKQRITSAKRAGSRSMAAVLEWGRPSLTAHPLRCFRPGNGQTQDKEVMAKSGQVPGLRARWLARDVKDPDAGYSISLWEDEASMRAYEGGDVLKNTI